MDDQGVPAAQLSDDELARQGTQAHATRNWVFLHGTAEQFRRHTERMLELEQEYLQRNPKRTWQGLSAAGQPQLDLAEVDALEQIRHLTRAYAAAVEGLLARRDQGKPAKDAAGSPGVETDAELQLLRAYAAAPDGRMHKLEAHQAARALAVSPAAVASLYKSEPPLLITAGEYRQITDAGRARVAETS